MTTQNKSAQNQGQTTAQAQTGQPQAPKINPDFSHRLSNLGQTGKSYSLADAVNTLSRQATGVLDLLSGNFIGENGDNQVSDEIIYWAIESAIASIKDIQAIVAAYHEAQA